MYIQYFFSGINDLPNIPTFSIFKNTHFLNSYISIWIQIVLEHKTLIQNNFPLFMIFQCNISSIIILKTYHLCDKKAQFWHLKYSTIFYHESDTKLTISRTPMVKKYEI